jgi:hypothetical protein
MTWQQEHDLAPDGYPRSWDRSHGAVQATIKGDGAFFAEHTRLWRAYGRAIASGDEAAITRTRNELEAHQGAPLQYR